MLSARYTANYSIFRSSADVIGAQRKESRDSNTKVAGSNPAGCTGFFRVVFSVFISGER